MKMQEFWNDLAKDGSWASHYRGEPNLNTYNFYTRREAVMGLLENESNFGRILDVGCGTCDYLPVANRHRSAYFGIDYAYSMIEQARDQIDDHGKSHLAVVGDGQYLPYQNNSFDLVLAMGYIEYFSDPNQPLSEIRRLLKNGGVLVIQSFKQDLFGYFDRYIMKPLRSFMGGNNQFQPPSDWSDRKYSKQQLDALMKQFGFRRQAYVFNNFHVLPAVLRTRYPNRYIRTSESITRSNSSVWRFVAVNYIAKYMLAKTE